jgi:two-component system sensor histidine kinase/response regulator
MIKILVIEDEAGIRDSIVDILQAEDYIVDCAENGLEGLRTIDEFHPDLVICDIMMPELDGYGVLEKVRENPQTQTLPFIFLTAKTEKQDMRVGMDLGANDYLTKPFTHDELLHTIRARLSLEDAAHADTQKQLDALRANISSSLPLEVGTHLSEILTLADTLTHKADTLPTEGIVGLAKAIKRNAQQVSQLIEKLMLLAQLESLTPDAEVATTMQQQQTPHADKVVSTMAQQVAQEYLREADLELAIEPTSVQMSYFNFQRICQELISNAFKFSQDGTPVKVVCSHQNQSLIFYVIDYGKGMTSSEISQIGAYLKFTDDDTQQPGLGLGLAISQKLVELHKGSFLIESIPHKQTIVRITLPSITDEK